MTSIRTNNCSCTKDKKDNVRIAPYKEKRCHHLSSHHCSSFSHRRPQRVIMNRSTVARTSKLETAVTELGPMNCEATSFDLIVHRDRPHRREADSASVLDIMPSKSYKKFHIFYVSSFSPARRREI